MPSIFERYIKKRDPVSVHVPYQALGKSRRTRKEKVKQIADQASQLLDDIKPLIRPPQNDAVEVTEMTVSVLTDRHEAARQANYIMHARHGQEAHVREGRKYKDVSDQLRKAHGEEFVLLLAGVNGESDVFLRDTDDVFQNPDDAHKVIQKVFGIKENVDQQICDLILFRAGGAIIANNLRYGY